MPRPTAEFQAHLNAAFEAMQVGQTYTFRRTFTDGDLALFCGISGDYNPYHLDDGFAAQSPFGRRSVPGLLTASMATHIGGMLGFIATEMTFEFRAAVYPGDTIACTLTVVERDVDRRRVRIDGRWTNREGKEVLRARIAGFPSQMRLSPDGESGS